MRETRQSPSRSKMAEVFFVGVGTQSRKARAFVGSSPRPVARSLPAFSSNRRPGRCAGEFHLQPRERPYVFRLFHRPDGGIGRRAGLKIRFPLKECRFDPDSGHHVNEEVFRGERAIEALRNGSNHCFSWTRTWTRKSPKGGFRGAPERNRKKCALISESFGR